MDVVESHIRTACPICEGSVTVDASVYGNYSCRQYTLARCVGCSFVFVKDPFDGNPYDDDYYAGLGADPSVDYQFELDHALETIRSYEWHGIATVVTGLLPRSSPLTWLDYGCGSGGLVKYLRESVSPRAVGFEEGAIVGRSRASGIPVLDRSSLAALEGTVDVVTAIEVIEHTLDPVAELRSIRRLLKTGGLLFLTTGNSAAYADRLAKWSYVVPEIHVSYFEPGCLERALRSAGFRCEHRPLGTGFDEILKFKVLKSMRVRRRNALTDVLPRRLVARLADSRTHLSHLPIAWAD